MGNAQVKQKSTMLKQTPSKCCHSSFKKLEVGLQLVHVTQRYTFVAETEVATIKAGIFLKDLTVQI